MPFFLFGVTAALISILSFIPYIRDIVRGKTHPERASWFIWTALGSIAFFSQMAKGATDSLWMTGAQTLGVVVIFLLALRFGTGGLTKRDVVALVFAGIGLLLWYFTNEAAIALFLVIIIDGIGSLLTAIKSYEKPESETLISWVLFGISGLFGMVSVGSFDLILLAYPFYIVVANIVIVLVIYRGKRRLSAAQKVQD